MHGIDNVMQPTYILYYHDEEWELDPKGLSRVWGSRNECGGNVGAHDFQHGRLNIGVGDTLYMTILD